MACRECGSRYCKNAVEAAQAFEADPNNWEVKTNFISSLSCIRYNWKGLINCLSTGDLEFFKNVVCILITHCGTFMECTDGHAQKVNCNVCYENPLQKAYSNPAAMGQCGPVCGCGRSCNPRHNNGNERGYGVAKDGMIKSPNGCKALRQFNFGNLVKIVFGINEYANQYYIILHKDIHSSYRDTMINLLEGTKMKHIADEAIEEFMKKYELTIPN